MLRLVALASVLAGCSDSTPAKVHEGSSTVELSAGPVPVALAPIGAKRLRILTTVKEFVVIAANGTVHWGQPTGGPTPWAGEPADRRRGRSGIIEYDLDSYGTLSRDASATAVILADAATPARITLRDGIQAYGYKPVALAAGAANTAVRYQFGGEPWPDWKSHADLTVRVDQIDRLAGTPRTVVLQFTDATTTGELLAALTAVAELGAEQVRLHRMMGWGEIGPSDIVWVHGPVADDDEITAGEPAKVTIGEPRVESGATIEAISTAMTSASPRFRYCFEKRGAKPGTLELSFDVNATGGISNATAKGLDRAIESCVAGAVFDVPIPTDGVTGAAHATVPISFARGGDVVAVKPAKVTGFWCWLHQDGSVGMCAREEAECAATLLGFNQTMEKIGDAPSTNDCAAQNTAWQPSTPDKRPMPTKVMCKSLLGRGESCRQIR